MKQEDGIQDAELRRRAQQLGLGAAERLDVEQIAARVVDRLRHERIRGVARRGWRAGARWMRIAAAIVVLAGAGLLVQRTFHRPQVPTPLLSDELQGLSVPQLREVLSSLVQALRTPVTDSTGSDLNDLTTEQLEAVLQSLEG